MILILPKVNNREVVQDTIMSQKNLSAANVYVGY